MLHSKHTVSIIRTKQLMLYEEVIDIYSENCAKHTNTVRA